LSVWEALGDLDRGQPRVGEQLICALRDAIEQGRLPAGTRLPSTRDLAADLRVSRGLVVGAYERLVAEGRLAARRGSGTTVTAQVDPAAANRWDADPPAGPPQPHGTPEVAIMPLRPGVPDLGMFPRTAWRRAYERALTGAADADFDYGDPAGAFRLRAELSAYLGRIRAARVDVDRLLLTSGSTQAFALVAGVLRADGVTRIGVEEPGGRMIASCFGWHGIEPVPVAVDAEGIDVSVVERTGLGAVVVTPAHQYPTGVVLSPARRAALLDWARRTGGLVVEDDYDASCATTGGWSMTAGRTSTYPAAW
jgi:GntR family transcriptional regulator/MocR family aminotransferase